MAEKGKDADDNLEDCLNEQNDSDDTNPERTPGAPSGSHEILLQDILHLISL